MLKETLLNAGWQFLNEEYIYIPNDYDGCMAYGIRNIRRILEGIRENENQKNSTCRRG